MSFPVHDAERDQARHDGGCGYRDAKNNGALVVDQAPAAQGEAAGAVIVTAPGDRRG